MLAVNRRSFFPVTLVFALATCQRQSPAEENTVRRWLLCDECQEGELDSVVALGSAVVPRLTEALHGPPERGRLNVDRQARAMFARGPQVAISEERFVDHYVKNYEAVYQRRAAIALARIDTALARINTAPARAALLDAVRRDSVYREDVRRVVGQSAGVATTIAAGDTQQAPLGAFLAVNPSVQVRDTITNQPLGGVRVMFQVDSGGGLVQPTTRVTGSDGAAEVRWRLGPTDTINQLRAVGAGQTVRFRATGHPPGPRVVFVVQPSNGVRNQAMTPPPRIAVQDASGTTLTGFNQNAEVRILGMNVEMVQTIVSGVATLSGLVPTTAGTGFRIQVSTHGVAPPAFSLPFDVQIGP
jgi:hypothetical protein